jgi:serine protease Do
MRPGRGVRQGSAQGARLGTLLAALIGLSGCDLIPGSGAPAPEGTIALEAGSGRSAPGPLEARMGSGVARSSPSAGRESGAYGIEDERTTAVVRAAGRVSPSVVSVNVIRTQQVRVRDPFDDFFGGFFGGGSRTQSARVPGLGSGFVVDASGIVLTNDHVVRGAERILVTFPDGRDVEARLVGSDEATDVAVLELPGDGYIPVALGRSDDLRIGEWVIAFGNPFGNLISNPEPTVTVGVISALGRHIIPSGQERGFYLGMIQTDAAINPGNSGGPLVNALGEVIGMNASIFSRGGGSEGLGFAIPIERVLRIADDLVAHGEVRRAWVGIDVEPVDGDEFGRTRGVRVSRVLSASPAAQSGIRAGDRIVAVNDRRLATPLDFEGLLLDLRAGDVARVEVEGRAAPLALRAEESPVLRAERVTILQDLEVTTLTPALREAQGVAAEQGVLVTRISASGANVLGFREGDVILGVGQRQIQTADELARLLAQAPAGAQITIWFERNRGLVRRDFTLGR